MAQTLLSGVNIVYNGNPISDLSLGAFLDKFMEKKPKQNTWHGASEIEPAKKVSISAFQFTLRCSHLILRIFRRQLAEGVFCNFLLFSQLDMSHQLIGAEILSLAEADVPPEDVVFHKFYMNKKDSSKKLKKKKKKKTAEDEAAEDIYAVAGNDDESDNEEIENVMDSADPSAEAGDDYDYDDLDNIDNDDDEDLIAEGSDEEIGKRSHDDIDSFGEDSDGDIAEGQADDVSDFDEETEFAEASFGGDSDDDIAEGEADDGSDLDGSFNQGKKMMMNKRKSRKGAGASPFASIEDYQHLMEEEAPESDAPTKKKHKSKKDKKKRKLS